MKRVLTAVVLIPVILYVVYLGPFWLLFGVTAIFALICYSEYAVIAAGYGVEKLGPAGYASGILVLLARPQDGYLIFTLLTLIGLSLALRLPDPSKALPYAAALAFGIVYIFGSWKFAILLRNENAHWLGYGLILNWIGDTSAYFVGRRIGKHKMAPVVSPNKSWEGAMASLVGSLLFGVIYLNRAFPAISPLQAGAISVAANVAGQIGDFAESVLKRGAGLKDSSALLPGHGGFLDRVDSTLFALPVIYLGLYLIAPR